MLVEAQRTVRHGTHETDERVMLEVNKMSTDKHMVVGATKRNSSHCKLEDDGFVEHTLAQNDSYKTLGE